MSISSRPTSDFSLARDSKRFDVARHIMHPATTPSNAPHASAHRPLPRDTSSDGSFADAAEHEAETAPGATASKMRKPISEYDILLLSRVSPEESLARRAAEGLNPRIATCTEELCAHLETERFKLVVVECEQGDTDMVRLALETHRQLPSDDRTALIAFVPTPEGGLDLLRYTPDATAFAFLAAQEHQLRAHFLKLLNA
ncbi:hypothetical protein SAMN04487991_2853 [Celeribacter neptunius]|uniref:Uncharacterized protein n=2 Tax=Celeribacter neptunius TaxID=588602 RepID=A0A1I3TVC5_9RHOB|nr:hypothetical protein SAMN04487991_2853 [Celeribacter neptunius]